MSSTPEKQPGSLADACYASLTTTPLDHARLEQLPQHMLVQLLAQAVTDRDQANALKKQQAEEIAKLQKEKKGRYLIDPPIVLDGVGQDMYTRVEAVTAKWVPCLKYSDFTAREFIDNADDYQLMYLTESKIFVLDQRSIHSGPKARMWQVISSALLLYRLCCLFQGLHVEVEGSEGYKVVWHAEVQHVDTGESVGFSEWKGSSIVRLSNLEGPKNYQDDMLELLNLICDEHCPHPYGIVAGTVA